MAKSTNSFILPPQKPPHETGSRVSLLYGRCTSHGEKNTRIAFPLRHIQRMKQFGSQQKFTSVTAYITCFGFESIKYSSGNVG